MSKIKLHPAFVAESDFRHRDSSYYLVGKNGTFLRKKLAFGHAIVPVTNPWWLEDVKPCVKYDLPKLPENITSQALYFFRKVFEQFRSEAAVVIYYSPEKGYNLWCPRQSVSGGSVSYKRDDKPNLGHTVGTIHSHCDFSAFHSGTDVSDESNFDGLHITMGHVNQNNFSMVSSLVSNDNRYQVNPEDYCEEITVVGNGRYSFPNGLNCDKIIVEREWLPKVSSGGRLMSW